MKIRTKNNTFLLFVTVPLPPTEKTYTRKVLFSTWYKVFQFGMENGRQKEHGKDDMYQLSIPASIY